MTYRGRRIWRWLMAGALLLGVVIGDVMVVNRWWSFGWHWGGGSSAPTTLTFCKGWMIAGQSDGPVYAPGLWKQKREYDWSDPGWVLSFPGQGQWDVVVPLWAVMAPVAGFAGLAFWKGCLIPLGRCRVCGYELAGLARGSSCPECGPREGLREIRG